MAKLETQIHQIYYLPEDNTQASLILTDEEIGASHLFLVADLVKITKKTESNDLKKISEIILSIFRENKKLSGEALFESCLAEINQRLADLAHGGKKSWLGKFSALVVLRNNENVFLANTGQMTAMLYRGGEFLEVLNPEQRGLHPLKTFSNFTTGKVKPSDVMLLTTSNLFNFVALDNLNRMMSDSVNEVAEKISRILKDTGPNTDAFASFFVQLNKPAQVKAAAALPDSAPKVKPQPAPVPEKPRLKVKSYAPEILSEPIAEEEIYAPLPGTPEEKIAAPANAKSYIPKIPKFTVPKFSIRLPKFAFLQGMSTWAKFFLASFVIFLILFAATIINLFIHKHKKQTIDQTQGLVNAIVKDINDTQSALIYRNQTDAIKLLSQANTDLAALKNVNPTAYQTYSAQVSQLTNQVNHITEVANPTVLVTLKHTATNLARAGAGFYIADADSGSITTYNTNDTDKSGKDLFLLNKIGQIHGLVFIPNVGGVVITDSEMYQIDTKQNQFNLLHIYPKTNFAQLHFVNPDRLYTLDRAANQALRIQFSKDQQIAPVSLIKSALDLSNVVDLGTDTNVYLLSNNDLTRYNNGNLDTNFKIAQPTDKITSANKLFVANNIYIVESAKKRVLVYNKSGALVTQMSFPNVTDIRDIYVDEASRNMFLLDSNRILSITF